MNSLNEIASIISRGDDFTLVAHVSPDGDALGSMLGLQLILEAMGKRSQSVCDGRVPPIYGFLPGAEWIVHASDARRSRCVIAVDCADKHRMGIAAKLFDAAETTVAIDHHATNAGFAQANYISGGTASTGEIIFELANIMGVAIDGDMATCLYTAVLTDTGRFSHSNTTPNSLFTASKLIEAGADASRLNRLIYSNFPCSKLRMLGRALNLLELFEDGRIGLIAVSQDDMASVGASNDDCEGIVEHIRDIDTVEIAVFVRQARDGSYKVSMRSKDYADVAKISERYGGGGHERAAGFTSHFALLRTRAMILDAAQKALKKGLAAD